jgi:hypothetical protein
VVELTLPAPKVLLMGDGGTGKTTSLQTLTAAGVKPFVLFLEQGMEVLGPKLGSDIHYKHIKATAANWGQMAEIAKAINLMSFETLTKMQDNKKTQHVGFMDVITAVNNFTCDCCKQSWGDVAKWNTDRALCIDGLSGLSEMGMALGTGLKPVKNMADWGVAQNAVRMFLAAMTGDVRCMFILLAHIEREKDELTGGTHITVKTLGNKLAPDLPPRFSEVILAQRLGVKFTWNTAAGNAVTKARNLPIKDGLEPSFADLITGWKAKGGKIEETKL